ncbi:MAG: J domain-containing protein [Streptococcus salivarius]|nr:J domain-containing protein [Streptococcus salivarius]
MNFWSILGIQPTNNLKDIKRAYAKQSKVYHPEDDPENFQRLQKAYQEALAWQKSHSGNEETSAVIGHKQADGSVVGMVSASQLEASFKQAADASKSGQGQESIDELELTDYATGKVDDEQVTEYEVQQVDAEEEQKQLDELTLSDTHETFNHSEPHSRTREDSVLREDLSIENQDSFLQVVEEYFLCNPLTISKLKGYINQCSDLGWLGDRDFAYRLTKTIGAILERGGLKYETLEGLETLAKEFDFTLLEAYLCDLLDKKYKQDVWQGRPIRQVTEVTEPTRTGQKIIVVYFLIMVCGIFFLANGFFTREMLKSQPKKIQVITGLTGNELVSQGTVDKAASAISDLAKKSDKPISDTKKVVYDQASSTFVIEDSTTGQRQELPGVTEVYVLPVYENGQETKEIATTTDGSNWELRDSDGQVRGPITLSVAMSSDIAIKSENGSYTTVEKE